MAEKDEVIEDNLVEGEVEEIKDEAEDAREEIVEDVETVLADEEGTLENTTGMAEDDWGDNSPEEGENHETDGGGQSVVEADFIDLSAYTTRGQSLLISFGFCLLSVILTLVLGLGLLAGLNRGSLIFASTEQVSRLALELERIDKEVQSIEQDLKGLQSRIDNLEGMSGRMDEIEEITEEMVAQFTQVSSKVENMDQVVEGFETDMETLLTDNARFHEFFNGLKQLLSNVLPVEE